MDFAFMNGLADRVMWFHETIEGKLGRCRPVLADNGSGCSIMFGQ